MVKVKYIQKLPNDAYGSWQSLTNTQKGADTFLFYDGRGTTVRDAVLHSLSSGHSATVIIVERGSILTYYMWTQQRSHTHTTLVFDSQRFIKDTEYTDRSWFNWVCSFRYYGILPLPTTSLCVCQSANGILWETNWVKSFACCATFPVSSYCNGWI